MSMIKPTAEGSIHELNVKIMEQCAYITLDGQTTILRVEDLPEKFHIGVTACEGFVRLYDFDIHKNTTVCKYAEGERYI